MMLARPVGRSASRLLRNKEALANARTSLPSSSAVRYASSSSAGPSKPAGGQNSLVVGAAALGVTFLVGYGLAKGTGTTKSAKQQLETAAVKAKEQAPKAVTKKVQEAKETISPSSSKTSSSSTSSKKSKSPPSSPSPAASPAVSSTGATEPLPLHGEDDNISVTSSISDPGSLSDGESGEQQEEEEDPSQAAFNPETGEINWDCPCLGGMAHGICGEQFREAFSCFVYSQAEPKGQDCIEKFRNMQECFAAHPEVYGEVMGDDEDDEDVEPLSPAPTGEESDYDIISAVEKAIGGNDSK